MKNIDKHSIKNYWQKTPERFSEKYEWNLTNLFSPTSLFLDARRKKVNKLIGIFKGKNILDVGCGSGIFMLDFIYKGARVTGIDYSQKMLQLAQDLFNKYKIPEKSYVLKKAKASSFKSKNKSFDVIIATGLTDYISLEETMIFLKKSSKVLKDNGSLIISFPSTESPFALLRKGAGLAIRQKLFHLPPIASTFSSNEIKNILEKNGFTISHMSKIFYAMWIVKAKKHISLK